MDSEPKPSCQLRNLDGDIHRTGEKVFPFSSCRDVGLVQHAECRYQSPGLQDIIPTGDRL